MPRRKYSHVHQYHRTYPRGFGVGPLSTRRAQWECALPDCTHYLPSNMAEPVGKMSICNECMEPFLLDEDNMKDDKPKCTSCSNPDLAAPADFNFERYEAIGYIANKRGVPKEEVSEDEVDKLIQLRKLKMKE